MSVNAAAVPPEVFYTIHFRLLPTEPNLSVASLALSRASTRSRKLASCRQLPRMEEKGICGKLVANYT